VIFSNITEKKRVIRLAGIPHSKAKICTMLCDKLEMVKVRPIH